MMIRSLSKKPKTYIGSGLEWPNSKKIRKNSYDVSFACPLCQVQPDTQSHSVQCPVVRTKVEVKGTYSDIYMEDIPTDISKTLMEISKLREDLI